ncbi:glycosyltransferase family 2 protein [Roseixanthobacter pseudopolyaromaticivorans]|uniref:glycosyltransferase family 2 protein n=1 Tax=Xanthobacteraceae TaxID=335928 RepID=UPI003728D19A
METERGQVQELEALRAALDAERERHARMASEAARFKQAYEKEAAEHARLLGIVQSDFGLERDRLKAALDREVARAEDRARQHESELASLSYRLEAAHLRVELERNRRHNLSKLFRSRPVAARRGARGVLGRLIRRFGGGELEANCRLLLDSGLFDRNFYTRQYPLPDSLLVEPVVDYLLRGGFEGCRPNPVFDSEFYFATYPDVRNAGMNPLWHYISYGEAEGRIPSASFSPYAYREEHPELEPWQSPLADYLARHANQERDRSGLKGAVGAIWDAGMNQLRSYRYARMAKTKIPALRAGLAALDGRYLSFRPGRGGVQEVLPAARTGTYEWRGQPSGYTYIAPRRPADLDARIARFRSTPRFSIVVPLYNTPLDVFRRMVASVEAQWYPHWELILVDDRSPREEVRQALAALKDPRVVIKTLSENQGIAGATNEAIALAGGDFLVFLDHDDELTEDCLYELAACIDRDDPDFIYSDEDKIATNGTLVEPFFKPDWSPDTLMSLMYTCHVSCVRRSLALKVGPLRSEYDGSQDWDFVLRVTENTRKISHIPKVLYHWRIIPGSAAAEFDAKPEALAAAVRLRLDAMQRRGVSGACEPVEGLQAYMRVRYDVIDTPRVSIIIPSKNNWAVLRQCLRSIQEKSVYKNVELVVVDNGSSEADTLAYLDSLAGEDGVRVVRHDFPFNFSELCNVGVRASSGEILLFLNDDTEVVTPDWLDRMVGYAQQSHIGAVGAKLLYPKSQRVQHAGVIYIADGPSHAFLGANAKDPCYYARNMLDANWLAVTGACLMVERSKFETVGGFDEAFPVAYNDVDLCFRLVEAGLFNVVCPAAELLHYESMSRGIDHVSAEKMARLRADKRRLDVAHPLFFMRDPFFSPNLHPNDLTFRVPS